MPNQFWTRQRRSGPLCNGEKQLMPFLVALVLSACLLSSCGGEARLVSPLVEGARTKPTPGEAATPATVATPTRSTPVPTTSIEPVVWASAVDASTQAPTQTMQSFPSDIPSMYACVSVNGLHQGVIVEGSWTYNGTSLDSLTTELILPDDVPRRWLAFHISRDRDESWPLGTYAISIAVDGQVVQTASVEVTASN